MKRSYKLSSIATGNQNLEESAKKVFSSPLWKSFRSNDWFLKKDNNMFKKCKVCGNLFTIRTSSDTLRKHIERHIQWYQSESTSNHKLPSQSQLNIMVQKNDSWPLTSSFLR